MECPEFFDRVATTLEAGAEPSRTTAGGQCVYEFYHPRTVEALGTDGLATTFNRSGVVWAPPAGRLGVELRVPEPHGEAVGTALADAPVAFDRSDHRGVPGPDETVVTVLHFGARAAGLGGNDVEATLRSVASALAV